MKLTNMWSTVGYHAKTIFLTMTEMIKTISYVSKVSKSSKSSIMVQGSS